MSDAQLFAYERFWLAVHDEQAYLEGRYNKGYTKGRAKGRNDEKLDTARRMKYDGMPVELIVKYIGLTAEEIGRL